MRQNYVGVVTILLEGCGDYGATDADDFGGGDYRALALKLRLVIHVRSSHCVSYGDLLDHCGDSVKSGLGLMRARADAACTRSGARI